MKPISLLCLAGSAALLLASCAKKPALPHLTGADSLAIIRDNTAHRTEVDTFFRTDPSSPFLHDTATHYTGIKWFPIDPLWCAHSALHRYENPDTVVILGTKGEERRELRYGYFTCVLPDDHGAPIALKVNVYKFTPYDGQRYYLFRDVLNVWFTDRTSGKETYDVGRYVEIGNELPDPSHVYTIDFNKAYNPYCAYSSRYSCAIPRKEDHLDIALRVGEMKYHD